MAGFDNLESLEGTVVAPTELTLNIRSKKITLTNDHATNDFSFKFNATENYSTLMAGESLSFGLRTSSIWINGDSVPYRIWVFT